MTLKKNNFIEIEFTAKIKDGDVFDSNIKKDLEKLNPKAAATVKPFIFALDQDMFLKGIDEFLIGKEIGEYNIELTPEKAFGKRNPAFIQKIPAKIFKEQNINPVQGMIFNFDNKVGKIIAISGGRIIVDFIYPLSGRDVIYYIKIFR